MAGKRGRDIDHSQWEVLSVISVPISHISFVYCRNPGEICLRIPGGFIGPLTLFRKSDYGFSFRFFSFRCMKVLTVGCHHVAITLPSPLHNLQCFSLSLLVVSAFHCFLCFCLFTDHCLIKFEQINHNLKTHNHCVNWVSLEPLFASVTSLPLSANRPLSD